ncbi:MAG TPA: DoxX family protein [Terriglobales bacterium]|jgi:putative oxidoreductase|nr:DoxX family protein [Terriglobales bacterium]
MGNGSSIQSWGVALLRVMIGLVFLIHGWEKLFVFGIHRVTGYFGSIGVPSPALFAPLVTAIELLGGMALILGVGTRWAAVLLVFDMMGAIFAAKLSGGFFAPAGFEYELTLLVANLSLLLTGPGAASLDKRIRRRA